MVARGLASGRGVCPLPRSRRELHSHKEIVLLGNLLSATGRGRGGGQAGAQQAGGCDHRGVLAPGRGPAGPGTPGTSLLSCFLSDFSPQTQRCLLVLTSPGTPLLPLCGLYPQ